MRVLANIESGRNSDYPCALSLYPRTFQPAEEIIMAVPTVAEYAVMRLSELGIDRVFGVPGDYAFPIDDAIEACPALTWIGCANELNAAYAADGYARRRGDRCEAPCLHRHFDSPNLSFTRSARARKASAASSP